MLNSAGIFIEQNNYNGFDQVNSLRQFEIYVKPDGSISIEVGFYGDGMAFVLIDRTKDKPEISHR